MKINRIEFDSPVDAFAYLVRQLAGLESRHGMGSEEFYDRYQAGTCDDSADSIAWSNYYQAYMELRSTLEGQYRHAA